MVIIKHFGLNLLWIVLIAVQLAALATDTAAQPISNEQRRALYGLSRGVQPGLYQIRALHSQLCLANFEGVITHSNYLAQYPCSDTSRPALFAILPHPLGGYTIRLVRDRNVGKLTTCTTIARGVIIGPKAIHAWPCDFEPDSRSWCDIGANDQTFLFNRVGPNVFEIGNRGSGDNRVEGCFDIRDQSRAIDGNAVMFDCNQQANQRFELILWGSIFNVDERVCLFDRGWVGAPDGLRRAVPVLGVDLPGMDSKHGATADDQGRSCAQACAEDRTCHSFTWVRPGVQTLPGIEGSPAICWHKSGVPQPLSNPNTASGVVRP